MSMHQRCSVVPRRGEEEPSQGKSTGQANAEQKKRKRGQLQGGGGKDAREERNPEKETTSCERFPAYASVLDDCWAGGSA
jgi:hypothetical protein